MNHTTHQEGVKKLAELIKDIDIAMLTTVDEDGTLRSRPMSTQEVEFDGDLWFLTSDDTAKVGEISRENRVNVSYAKLDKQRFVSVSGTAEIVNDKAKIEELWSPIYKAYFPKGLDDPSLRLLKIHAEKAEYWESSGLIPTVIAFVQSMAGKEAEMGENEKIQLA
ncbi:Pyridoxamine 5'-phosphate oxidase-related FMN-binding protein [Candidatus Promineifilum breve]|uniref:Pyridoxamine 5'-phosphate oxidase-related FMN-binding protein n=1 Tax=Candidatus Promineifilum breve TaxID=1806508 RepID=A0A160T8N8_9CHLR|nr:pyridoxamine 5'-phosphate oxidase family protein [Candidatus Promineifilum breve]CUS05535.1 Pyridoxamine 5'-phosphate oxidase-related FMN-binding protein [Candidatus Promineifilum breve]